MPAINLLVGDLDTLVGGIGPVGALADMAGYLRNIFILKHVGYSSFLHTLCSSWYLSSHPLMVPVLTVCSQSAIPSLNAMS